MLQVDTTNLKKLSSDNKVNVKNTYIASGEQGFFGVWRQMCDELGEHGRGNECED